jgi:DNA-binding transcriptional LysR family regulator
VELRQVRCFVTVAQELHVGRAAALLGTEQPAVRREIGLLERELRAELLDRSAQQVRLTAAGERFLPEARALLAAEARARAVVAGPPAARTRTLRVGTGTGLGAHLDRVVETLAELAPHLTLELIAAPARERLDRVAGRALDAAVVRGNPVAASPGTVALADLAGLPLVLTERRSHRALFDLVVSACHDAGFTPVPGPRTGSLDDTLAAIRAAGPGQALWTVVYASHARRLHTSEVRFLPFRNPGMELTAYLAVPRADPPAGLDLLLRACAPTGGSEVF